MVRRPISKDLKETALALSLWGICDWEIRESTGISEPLVLEWVAEVALSAMVVEVAALQ